MGCVGPVPESTGIYMSAITFNLNNKRRLKKVKIKVFSSFLFSQTLSEFNQKIGFENHFLFLLINLIYYRILHFIRIQ